MTVIVHAERLYVPAFALSLDTGTDGEALRLLMLTHWDELEKHGVIDMRFVRQHHDVGLFLEVSCKPFLGVIRSRRYVERLLREQNIPYARSACRVRP